jgi:hypothetical protein
MKLETLPRQSLETSSILALVAILIVFVEREMLAAMGIAIGAALALFRLWTFMIAVPRLFAAKNTFAPVLLGLLTAIKLPIYALALSFEFS